MRKKNFFCFLLSDSKLKLNKKLINQDEKAEKIFYGLSVESD